MDDEAKFGPVFYSLSFGEAIGRDLLSDYQVAIIGVDDPTYRKLAEQGVFVTGDGVEVTDARTLAAHIGLAKAMRDFDLHKTISFHSRIDKARKFASDFPDVVAWMPDDEQPDGELVTSHVSGKMSAGQRDIRIQQLGQLDDHQRGLLSNARCLGEGIDVPTLDGVAFIDPKSSHIDIIQAVGRAIRKTEGKTVGTIILPVFIDTEGDPDIALDSSAFKPIWSVLKALRSHDETLAEQLDALRRQLGRKGTSLKLPSKLHIDLPTSIGQGFADAFDVRLVESSTASWEFWFGLLEDFVGSKGHSRVSSGENFDGFRLGNWLGRQRQSHHRRQLDQSRSQRLESLPGWTWDPYADVWDENYRRLAQIAEKTGTCAILQGFVTSDNVALGTWVTTQRQRWNNRLWTRSAPTGWKASLGGHGIRLVTYGGRALSSSNLSSLKMDTHGYLIATSRTGSSSAPGRETNSGRTGMVGLMTDRSSKWSLSQVGRGRGRTTMRGPMVSPGWRRS